MLKLSMIEQKEIVGGKTYIVYWGGDFKEFKSLKKATAFRDQKIKQGYYSFIKSY